MRWSLQLRWKLFASHAIIIIVAVGVLLISVEILLRNSLGLQSPLLLGTDPIATGELTQTNAALADRIQLILQQALLVAGICAMVAAIVISLFVSRRIVEPLQDLTEVSQRLALGYYLERTTIRSDDEFARLSQSINQLAEALDQTEQRRLSLLADVAHELRTPLTTIEGYMEGLLDGVISPDEQTFTVVRHEAERLRRLTEELSLLSRVEAGEVSIKPRPCDPAVLLKDLQVRFQPQFSACEIDTVFDIPTNLPKILVDPDRIAQVLINLLSNALRYTPEHGRVQVALIPFEDYVQITVRDSGIGIASEHLPLIFERFYRVDKSRTRASGGTGIGLTIARYLVYAHEGDIWAESDGLGHGAAFHITLPVYRPELQIIAGE
ncbi:MAG: ATP-binding protein [Roseiflexaceae bacterium]